MADYGLPEHTIELGGRKIRYDDQGSGPVIVFIHGVWATGGLWDPVVDQLRSRYRCIQPTLPLGCHHFASPPSVDHSPQAIADMIGELLENLDVHDVTLVGNDTGGGLCQLLIAKRPARVGRLVLTNCDAFEDFPPRIIAPLYWMTRLPWLWNLFARRVGNDARTQRIFWSTISNREPDMILLKMLMGRFGNEPGIRDDLRATVRLISPTLTLEAAHTFATYEKDVLILWGDDDIFFKPKLGRRLAAAFPRAKLQSVPNAKLFVMNDQPDVVTRAIDEFANPSRAVS